MVAASPGDLGAFAAGSYADAAGHVLPYRLLVPERSEPGVRYPLVLVLHGAGERGTGNAAQLGHQLLAVAVAPAYAFVATFVILKVLDLVMGLRVDSDSEREGLDLALHGESIA